MALLHEWRGGVAASLFMRPRVKMNFLDFEVS
jgi:hypothetical protein